MNCSECGHENPAGNRFCGGCGGALTRACPACAHANPPDHRFCGACGATLQSAEERRQPPARDPRAYTPRHLVDKILQTKAALEGERKQVTVLFVDVKGSLELADQLDPEEWHRVLERFFEILTEGVHRFEGTVNQYTGDGIMALFGAPIAHEDHAHRACYAALHLSETLKAHADALRVEHGLNFSVRMGINSGEVVVGRIGDDLRMDYTAQGQTVGLAQRMETLAESGKALIAADTIDLVQGYFALRDLGAMHVKGVDAPVRVAELEGVGRMRTRLDRSRARGLSKFVGRDEELGRLESALRRTLDGDGQVVAVMAEAGSGKSRLCFEFLEQCRFRGITVRTTTGVPHGRALPLQPILEFYREIFGITAEDGDLQARQKIAGAIAQTAPEELEWLPLLFEFMRVPDPSRPAPDFGPEERLEILIALLRRVTAARSRREPAVLVFEDLHWVDPDSETIIEGFVDAAAGTRTLVLMNFRPEYRARWAGRTHFQQISLRPLDEAAAKLLLADWLGDEPSLEGFVDLVSRSTAGNPFFMEEVVQAQIESGALAGVRGRFRLAHPIESIEVPASVQSLLAARIDRLDEESKRLLQAAAVIGENVPEELLALVAELDRDALQGHLRGLVQSEFLFESSLYPETEYGFKHPLTREVAYASLLRDRRHTLHAAVAKGIESLAGEAVEQQATLLSHHWEQAGQRLEAARWQTRIAQKLGMNAGEAIFHWRKVVDLLAGEDGAAEARALRGQARSRLVYMAGRTAAPEEEIEALFQEARRELGSGDSRDLAWTLASYAITRNGAGHVAEAHRWVKEAEQMARRLGDPGLLAMILVAGISMHSAMEHPTEASRYIDEIERLDAVDPMLGFELSGFRARTVAFVNAHFLLVRDGRGDEIGPLLSEFRRFVGDNENPFEQVWLHNCCGMLSASRGDPDAALEHGSRAADWAMRTQNLFVRVGGWTAAARGLLCAGRLDEALEQIEQAIGVAVDRNVARSFAVSVSLALLCEIQLLRGDVDAALAAAERALDLSRASGFANAEARYEVFLARGLLARGDLSAAAAALARAEDRASRLDARDLPPCIEEARAELARADGDAVACERALREAARLHRANGEPWLASQAEARI